MRLPDAGLERWRLVLGEPAEERLGGLSETAAARDRALDWLYGRDPEHARRGIRRGGLRGPGGEDRSGGLGAAQVTPVDWLDDVHRLFPKETIERLERADDTARGLLYAEEAAAEPLLTAAYEHCAAEMGLRIRVKEPAPGSPWWTGYLLSGADPEEIAPRLVAQARQLPDSPRPSPLAGLLTELAALEGAGVARIGAFAAVRIADALLCGFVTDDALDATDPAELAAHLDGHVTTLRWDPARFTAAAR